MTDYPEEATLFRIAAERLAGKPFTLSEYNHPAPLDAQAECVPMVASFAAAQDWDGVWLYTYSHSGDDWDRKHLNSYFDIDTNPAKWGFMRAGAAIFRHPWIARLNSIAFVRFAEPPESLAKFGLLHLQYDRDMFAILAQGWLHPIKWQSMLECIYLPSYAHESVIGSSTADDCAAIKWSVDQGGKGLYYAHSLRAQVSAGHAQRFAEMTNGRISITSPEFATVAITPLEDREHVLIAACGRCENTGMQFSKDRRTVGRNWGQAPAQIEPVEGRVVLYGTGWTCQALAPDGSPKQPVPITYENDRGILELSPRYATMWYLLRRGE